MTTATSPTVPLTRKIVALTHLPRCLLYYSLKWYRPRHFTKVSFALGRRFSNRKSLAHLSQHWCRLRWNGTRLPCADREGEEVGSELLEDLWRVPFHQGYGCRDRHGNARINAIWVSSSLSPCTLLSLIPSPLTVDVLPIVEAHRIGLGMLTHFHQNEKQRSATFRSLSVGSRFRQHEGTFAISSRSLWLILAVESDSDREEPGQCEDFP